MRFRLLFCLCALVAFGTLAGCDRGGGAGFTAEVDDPNYRRGKDLLKQSRNQEALAAFLKVIQERAEDAPESHLEIGILYQHHIKDPLAAIYHYRKFRELKPNSPQAELVRQRIDAATREFAATLPLKPMENQLERTDMVAALERLRRENVLLREQLTAARAGRLVTANAIPAPTSIFPAQAAESTESGGYVGASGAGETPGETEPTPSSPFTRLPMENDMLPGVITVPTPAPAQAVGRPQAPARPAPAGRKHTVAVKDTLYSISLRYYGTGSRWTQIYEANRDVMKTSTDLRIGMELKIP